MSLQMRLFDALDWDGSIEAYLAHRKADGSSPHSLGAFRRDLDLLRDLVGDDPATVTANRARDLVRRLLSRASSEATARRRHGTWRAFYAFLETQGWIGNSPFRFGLEEETPRQLDDIDYLSPDQARRLTDAAWAYSPAAGFLVDLVLASGLKTSEIAAVQHGDLSEQAGTLHVRGKHPRTLSVPTELFEAYIEFQDWLADQGRVPSVDSDLAVPYSTRWMEKQLQAAIDQVAPGFGWNVTFGSLRWTYAVRSLQQGASEQTVRDCLGITETAWELHTRQRLMRHAPTSPPAQAA